MAIPDPPKAGSPFCALWTGGWNPKTPKINNFFETQPSRIGPQHSEQPLVNAPRGVAEITRRTRV